MSVQVFFSIIEIKYYCSITKLIENMEWKSYNQSTIKFLKNRMCINNALRYCNCYIIVKMYKLQLNLKKKLKRLSNFPEFSLI